MRRNRPFASVVAFALLISSTALAADRPDRPVRVRRGAEVSDFDVVYGFFNAAFHAYTVSGDLYRDFVKDLGIEAGSPSERALIRATLSAQLVDKTTFADTAPYENDPEGAHRVQYQALSRKVKEYRNIWRELLRDLGGDAVSVKIYVERMIRPGVSVTEIGEPDPDLDAILKTFSSTDGGRN